MTIAIRTWGGIGDVLLMTPALRALKASARSVPIVVYCGSAAHADVLRHNPNIDRLKVESSLRFFASLQLRRTLFFVRSRASQSPVARFMPRPRTRHFHPQYGMYAPMLSGRPVVDLIGELMGVEIQDRTLEIVLLPEERRQGQVVAERYPNPIAIQVTGKCSANKNWPVEKWNALVARNPDLTFLQLGVQDEPRVEGAVDFRGKTSLREAFALLSAVKAFVGVDSSMAHATNALGTPAVVLFGPSTPAVWSHPNIQVVSEQMRCAPCIDTLFSAACPYGAPCMARIAVEQVERSLRPILDNRTNVARCVSACPAVPQLE